MAEDSGNHDLLELTAQIVSAHVSNNSVPPDGLGPLIHEIYRTLVGIGEQPARSDAPGRAVPPRKSIFPDYLVCLEDGKKLKMLKRHLQTSYNMTPEQYRQRWGLTSDYPMVAPNYAKRRSALAKQIGLGTRPRHAVRV